jgi:transposase-like protein
VKKSSGKQKRFSSAERLRLIRQYRKSGLTQKQFAQQNGIRLGTFEQWLLRERKRDVRRDWSKGFQEVKLPLTLSSNAWAAELSLEAGLSLRLSSSAPVHWVCDLVKGLRPS